METAHQSTPRLIVDEKFNAFVTENPYPSIEEWVDSGYYNTPIYYAYLEHIKPLVGRNYNDPSLQAVNDRLFNRKVSPDKFRNFFTTAFNMYNSQIRQGEWR